MPKEKGFLTPKAIGNRIKAKGLQKLRWYCEMCAKQCRDENGFKCHCLSESHTRQMALFRENPQRFMDSYSVEFEKTFMEILKRRGKTRVKANSLYQDLVSDRQHTHMNSTKWETLSSFVQYLGKTGKAEVDLVGGKGWYIKYIDRDPLVIARQEALAEREANDIGDEEKNRRRMAQQIEDAKKHEEESGLAPEIEEPTELVREEGKDVKLDLSFKKSSGSFNSKKPRKTLEELSVKSEDPTEEDDDEDGRLSPQVKDEDGSKKTRKRSRSSSPSRQKKSKSNGKESKKDDKLRNQRNGSSKKIKTEKEEKSRTKNAKKGRSDTLALLMKENEELKAKQKKRKDFWIAKGIIVKVLNKQIGNGLYYKKKGEIIKTHNKYLAEVRMLEPEGDIVKIDQAELETVIPAIGREVLIVNGAYEGEKATLLGLNEASFSVKLRIESGLLKSKVLETIKLEDVCKLA